MNLPRHLFRLLPNSTGRAQEGSLAATRAEDHGGKPFFRPPALPTPQQMNNELPFTVNVRPRLRDRP